MTRILIFKTPDAFGVIEVDAPVERIVRAINHGRWQDYLPGEPGPLYARQQWEVVVVTHSAPVHEEDRCVWAYARARCAVMWPG
jgi:hypothetical protein